MIILIDIINSLIQSILISYFPYYCLKKEGAIDNKSGLRKVLLTSVAIFINTVIVTKLIGGTSLSIIIINIFNMIIIGFAYFKYYNTALLSYFIIYITMQVAIIVLGNIHWSYVHDLLKNQQFADIVTMYLPMYILEIAIIILRNKVYRLYKFLSRYKYCFEVGLFSVIAFDYILSLSLIIHGNDKVMFKNLIVVSCIILLVVLFVYVVSINNKINEIKKLNIALSNKNNELKKIKHDYGSQISYINGLYIMEQYERLGDLLKSIIDGNNEVSGNIKIMSNEESIISCIVNSFSLDDINIIVEEEADISRLNISEYQLQKILSNIISNAITAIGSNGLIIVKTYRIFNNTYISIKNDGPKISEKVIDKIFDEGFTTKNSKEKENGFGLVIVKELVEKNNGRIYVDSNDDCTEFKIIFAI